MGAICSKSNAIVNDRKESMIRILSSKSWTKKEQKEEDEISNTSLSSDVCPSLISIHKRMTHEEYRNLGTLLESVKLTSGDDVSCGEETDGDVDTNDKEGQLAQPSATFEEELYGIALRLSRGSQCEDHNHLHGSETDKLRDVEAFSNALIDLYVIYSHPTMQALIKEAETKEDPSIALFYEEGPLILQSEGVNVSLNLFTNSEKWCEAPQSVKTNITNIDSSINTSIKRNEMKRNSINDCDNCKTLLLKFITIEEREKELFRINCRPKSSRQFIKHNSHTPSILQKKIRRLTKVISSIIDEVLFHVFSTGILPAATGKMHHHKKNHDDDYPGRLDMAAKKAFSDFFTNISIWKEVENTLGITDHSSGKSKASTFFKNLKEYQQSELRSCLQHTEAVIGNTEGSVNVEKTICSWLLCALKVVYAYGGGLETLALADPRLREDDIRIHKTICVHAIDRFWFITKLLGFDSFNGMQLVDKAQHLAGTLHSLSSLLGLTKKDKAKTGHSVATQQDNRLRCQASVRPVCLSLSWVSTFPTFMMSDEGRYSALFLESVLIGQDRLVLQHVHRRNVLTSAALLIPGGTIPLPELKGSSNSLINSMTRTRSRNSIESSATHYLKMQDNKSATTVDMISNNGCHPHINFIHPRTQKVFPVFMKEGQGIESGEGHGPRKEFFDSCAYMAVSKKQQAVDLTKFMANGIVYVLSHEREASKKILSELLEAHFLNNDMDASKSAIDSKISRLLSSSEGSVVIFQWITLNSSELPVFTKGDTINYFPLSNADQKEGNGENSEETTGSFYSQMSIDIDSMISTSVKEVIISSNERAVVLLSSRINSAEQGDPRRLQQRSYDLPFVLAGSVEHLFVPPLIHELGKQFAWINAGSIHQLVTNKKVKTGPTPYSSTNLSNVTQERLFWVIGWCLGNAVPNGCIFHLALPPLLFAYIQRGCLLLRECLRILHKSPIGDYGRSNQRIRTHGQSILSDMGYLESVLFSTPVVFSSISGDTPLSLIPKESQHLVKNNDENGPTCTDRLNELALLDREAFETARNALRWSWEEFQQILRLENDSEMEKHVSKSHNKPVNATAHRLEAPYEPINLLAKIKFTTEQFQAATIENYVKRLVEERIFGSSVAHGKKLIALLIEGFFSSGLGFSPILQSVTPKSFQTLFCGCTDDGKSDFSWGKTFRFIFDEELMVFPHGQEFRRLLEDVMEKDFTGLKKRLLLQFITGRTLLPPHPKSEHIKIEMPLSPMVAKEFEKTWKRLPTSHSCDNILELPNYLESLIFGKKSKWFKNSENKNHLILDSQKETVWETFSSQEREDMLKTCRTHLSKKLYTAVCQSYSYDLDEVGDNC